MHCYLLSPHVYLEPFDEDVVMLVADRDELITVNQAAAQVFTLARESVGDGAFSRIDCINFLLEHYELTRPDAERQMRALIGFAMNHGLVLKRRTAGF
jgi:hypothetical protein